MLQKYSFMETREQYEVVLQFGPNQVKGQRVADVDAAQRQVAIMRALYPEASVCYRPLATRACAEPKRAETVMLSVDDLIFEDDADTDDVSMDEVECLEERARAEPKTMRLSMPETTIKAAANPGTALLRVDELIFYSDAADEQATQERAGLYQEDSTRPDMQLPDHHDHPPFF